MPHDFWFLIAIGLAVAVTLFALTWLLSLKLNNFSFVDVTWSYALGLLAPVYVWLGDGFTQRKVVTLTMALLWSLRLGTYLFFRVKRHHPHEDVRYQVLRQNWSSHLARNFFVFFQAQARSRVGERQVVRGGVRKGHHCRARDRAARAQ